MARSKETSWLPREQKGASKRPSRKRSGKGAQSGPEATEQWLNVSKSKLPKDARAPSASSNGRPKARPQQRKPSRDGRRLAARLRRAKKDLAARDETIDQLESRVAELEQEVKRTGQRPKTGSSARSHVRTSGSPDLNQVTFEELRTLGLSVTQSARLVAARDMRDGFDSLDELDKLTGFPKEQVVELKELFSKAASRSR